jgi:glycogen synthase
VTVPELVVWVTLGLTTAAYSKILAFFLCLSFEKTGAQYMDRVEIMSPTQEADSFSTAWKVEGEEIVSYRTL